VDYCKHLNRRYKAKLPKGYVLRLPTEAEWEYALKANASDFSDPYVMYLQGSYAEKKEAEESIMVQDEDCEKWLSGFEALTEDDRKWAKEILLCPVGTKKPNQWGLYDMLSNGAEMTLDTLWEDAALHRYYTHDIKDEIKYAEEEVDPLRIGELDERFKPKGGNRINSIIRGSQLQEKRFVGDVNFKKFYPCDIKNNLLPSVSFRLCIGPDLVNEKKAERAKK
jgi:formylglycine-generating enzyme required for sulfatase activity